MALREVLLGFVLVFSLAKACNFVIPDLLKYTQLVFDSFDTRKLRNDLDCFAACGGLANCTGVVWNEVTKDCYILSSNFPHDGTTVSTLPVKDLVVFAREEFACGTHVCEDCRDAYRSGSTGSGLFILGLPSQDASLTLFTGYCEMDTADDQWLVFQRRVDGSVDFYRGWQSYAQGFGDLQAEFWLGNEMLHALTASGFTVLRVDTADFDDVTAYAEYQRFTVGNADDNYIMLCSDYTGTAGDSLAYSNGAQFTTFDADHDILYSANCAVRHHGAFWHPNFGNLDAELFSSSVPYHKNRHPGFQFYFFGVSMTQMIKQE
ncbi:hypothetical protein CAPTEDRAFT_206713 [Capitella teleta]|uniref:Fibrinogen C-terminal domain-containing protein n=1 Tax=Capitella teleta TaxID=283909 RepID=R7U3C6_CAPTE|nr:hypothetical protein CAPTEDRAFT_206713 [Capitella teleta]|eukprot:ELT97680.1 hypothetical protein CAPTEDRAFT_206713 [Capitella teleta]